MSNTLLSYFDQRIKSQKPAIKKAGPFITISRQTGCNGTGLAKELTKTLSSFHQQWKYINKEVLEESAGKLKIDPSKIQYVFDSIKRSHADEVLMSFSNRYYKSDKIVRKTITGVLQHFALDGNVIIVGRAGIAATKDLKGGLHIRLTAPHKWRVNSLRKRKAFEKLEVEKFIKVHDRKKQKLIEDFYGRDFSKIEFDLTINCEAFNRQQMIDLIISAMKTKKMIED